MVRGISYDGLAMLSIRIRSSFNSFFGRLSELSRSRIVIYTYKIVDPSYYYVLALSSDSRIGEHVDNIIRRDHILRRSKIVRIEYLSLNDTYVIHGLKSICEFYKLVEESGVSLLIPYTFHNGVRSYSVVGSYERLNKYLEAIKKYYGDNIVDWIWNDRLEASELAYYTLRNSVLSILMDKLTEQELKVLKTAYYRGYFNYPKDRRQADIGEELNISKVTISIHIRKALRKILSELLYISSNININ
jgi:predicted DNA binding protein